MNNSRIIIALLEEQVKLALKREEAHLELIRQQSEQLKQQSDQIAELTASIRSLEASINQKNADEKAMTAKVKAMSKLIANPSEKVTPLPTQQPKPAYNPKDRGNNGAKRKEFFDVETVVTDIYPTDPGFDQERARLVKCVESISYEYNPGKFIKRIYRQHNYSQDGTMYTAKAPLSPLSGSNYSGSFIAGMLQYRYIYSMPVERIIKLFAENGFAIEKPTAHNLIARSAQMLERLGEAMHQAILEAPYLSMDESYYTVLVPEKNNQGKGRRKGYIWAALAHHPGLVQYFYHDGSRSREVLAGYLPQSYRGAVQSDGLAQYEILETDNYPNVLHLGCFQHCKRKFLDIEADKEAKQVVDIINELYRKEKKKKEKWTPDRVKQYRQKYAPPILERLFAKLQKIVNDPTLPPDSPLIKAANYTLKRYDVLSNYIADGTYTLDNNAIERCQRYISLSRRNSLFAGSHKGAERMAFFYSLACSCRLHNINTFEYFADILQRMAYIQPNAPIETFRNLLPDKWKNKHGQE